MTNYERLFGTPEKAAATIEALELDQLNWCSKDEMGHYECSKCPYVFDRYGCTLDNDDFTWLKWLKQES